MRRLKVRKPGREKVLHEAAGGAQTKGICFGVEFGTIDGFRERRVKAIQDFSHCLKQLLRFRCRCDFNTAAIE